MYWERLSQTHGPWLRKSHDSCAINNLSSCKMKFEFYSREGKNVRIKLNRRIWSETYQVALMDLRSILNILLSKNVFEKI